MMIVDTGERTVNIVLPSTVVIAACIMLVAVITGTLDFFYSSADSLDSMKRRR